MPKHHNNSPVLVPFLASETSTAPKFYLQRDLLDRGWSRATIANVLGDPDRTEKRYGGGVIYLYAARRVHAAERSKKPWRKRTPQPSAATEIDVLDALQEVTRAAKRARDGASASYEAGAHGFARLHANRKRTLYEIKDQCVAHLIREAKLVHVEYHRFGDRWASLVSPPDRPGIRLHVPCPDPQIHGIEVLDLGDAIPSRARGRVKLADAVYTCVSYLADKPEIATYQWPATPRPVRVQECWECGGAWIGSTCIDCGRGA